MSEIIALTAGLAPVLARTSLGQLQPLLLARLCMSGRVTMVGVSRWTEPGGSYRTVQRWFQTPLDWGELLWTVVRVHLLSPNGEYRLAGDEVVVSKAGKSTHGLGRFDSSIAQRALPGISFWALWLVEVGQRRSYPLRLAQRLPAKAVESAAPVPKRPRGRPKGSQNHAKPTPVLTSELTLLASLLRVVLSLIAPLAVKQLVLDGFFGTSPATWRVRDGGLQLLSKLRHHPAWYLPYSGAKPRRGPTPRYGDKLDYRALPQAARCAVVTERPLLTETYSLTALHQDFPDPLKVVVRVKTQLKTGKRAQVLRFSTDLSLTAAPIVDYYSLRFQMEFNFRDAKQHWGLEDFMNGSEQAVAPAANLAFLMVNRSAVLLQPHRQRQPDFSVLDLKCHFRARRQLDETIKRLPDPPTADLISRLWGRLATLGGIRPPSTFQNAA